MRLLIVILISYNVLDGEDVRIADTEANQILEQRFFRSKEGSFKLCFTLGFHLFSVGELFQINDIIKFKISSLECHKVQKSITDSFIRSILIQAQFSLTFLLLIFVKQSCWPFWSFLLLQILVQNNILGELNLCL